MARYVESNNQLQKVNMSNKDNAGSASDRELVLNRIIDAPRASELLDRIAEMQRLTVRGR